MKTVTLTDRQQDFLQAMWDGNGVYYRVAYRMGVAVSTVKSHCHNVSGLLNVHDKTELICVALKRGYITYERGE